MIALLVRDLRLAFRAGGGFGLGLAFFLLVAVLVPWASAPRAACWAASPPASCGSGRFWPAFCRWTGIFALDFEDGSLDLLATAPLPLEGAVAAKALAHWLVTGLPLALAAPVLGAAEPAGRGLSVAGRSLLILGTPALSVIGAFGAALTVGLKRGGLLLACWSCRFTCRR
jgi:heme exporter protein B